MWVRVFYLNLPLGCCGFDLVVLCCFLYLCVVVSCLVLFRVVLCWLFGLVWFGFEQGSMLWLSILWLAGENLCAWWSRRAMEVSSSSTCVCCGGVGSEVVELLGFVILWVDVVCRFCGFEIHNAYERSGASGLSYWGWRCWAKRRLSGCLRIWRRRVSFCEVPNADWAKTTTLKAILTRLYPSVKATRSQIDSIVRRRRFCLFLFVLMHLKSWREKVALAFRRWGSSFSGTKEWISMILAGVHCKGTRHFADSMTVLFRWPRRFRAKQSYYNKLWLTSYINI